jgi:transposase
MLSLLPTVRIWLCLRPADMRKSFDGLAAMTRQILLQDPIASGHLFVFVSRRADRIKVLWWDRDGYALLSKRLERGTFRLPAAQGDRAEPNWRCCWRGLNYPARGGEKELFSIMFE